MFDGLVAIFPRCRVCSYGAAYVFTRNGSTWALQQNIPVTNAVPEAIDDNTLAIMGDGFMRIMVRNGGIWSRQIPSGWTQPL